MLIYTASITSFSRDSVIASQKAFRSIKDYSPLQVCADSCQLHFSASCGNDFQNDFSNIPGG